MDDSLSMNTLERCMFAVESEVFDVLQPAVLGMQKRRKVKLSKENQCIVVLKENNEVEARLDLDQFVSVCRAANDDKTLKLFRTGDKAPVPEVLKFRSIVERETFCTYLQAIRTGMDFTSDAEDIEDQVLQ
jgi:hypothetical protein